MRPLAPLIVALIAAACTTPERAPRGAPELAVEFRWAGVPPCSNVSPRIVVYDAPAATKRFRVELVDLDSAFGRHGGGEVEAAPGGVIPAGALKSYRGPCPSQEPIVYEMRVAALDAAGRVIARGAERATYRPATLRRPGARR
jgi:phosphatidylethanolamine-binding protein (PEBP) family uncharacterized protein